MHVTAKADYAVRAVVELAGSAQQSPDGSGGMAAPAILTPSITSCGVMSLRAAH